MIFRQMFDAESGTYTYLLGCKRTRAAIWIDTVLEQVERDITVVKELGLVLVWALDTHIHADHITGAGELRARTGCKTAVSRAGGVGCADLLLGDRDRLSFGDHAVEVIATPGHTPACVSYSIPGMVFTGDALLIRGCGRTDFPGGDAGTLYDSITGKLLRLPPATLVYPGHDYRGLTMSRIAEEREHNPRLQLDRAAFIRHMQELVLPNPKQFERALPANRQCGRPEHA